MENSCDPIGALGRYYAGRAYQLHLDPPEREKALASYRSALDLGSGLPLVETAAVSIIFIEVYDGPNSGALERLESLEPLAEKLRTQIGLREFHTTMGYAYLNFAKTDTNRQRALTHLLEADRLKATRPQAEAELWVAIGETANHLGQRETALTYYRKFADTYKRDRRNHLIRERIKSENDGK